MSGEADEYLRSLERIFEKRYASGTDEWTPDPAMRCLPALAQGILKLPRNARVLDIGCGAGKDVDYLARVFDDILGIDVCHHDAWSALAEKWHPGVRFLQADLLSLEETVPFDLVIDNGCFHHQHPSHYEAYLRQVRRLLADSGAFVLSTFKASGAQLRIDSDGRRHRYFEDAELSELLSAAGFDLFDQFDIYRVTKGDYYRLSFCRLLS